MKIAYISCLLMFALAAIATILQMWLELMAWDIYFKVMITLGLLFLLILGIEQFQHGLIPLLNSDR